MKTFFKQLKILFKLSDLKLQVSSLKNLQLDQRWQKLKTMLF